MVAAVQGPGWALIAPDARIAAWAAAAHPIACAAIDADPQGWRCGGTWHVGLDALPNGPDGALAGVAFPWAALPIAPLPLHHGQVSVIRPGYPQVWQGETEAAFAYRRHRDAAHLDGVLPIGPLKQRMVKEPHAWILGIPLNHSATSASPLVVWEGSHDIMRAALLAVLADVPPDDWDKTDITAAYHAARKQIFATCPRVELPVSPGQATLVHRLALHGMAPWVMGSAAPAEGRMIAYFRPMLPSVAAWLDKCSDQSHRFPLADGDLALG
jgi:hypothetical protein